MRGRVQNALSVKDGYLMTFKNGQWRGHPAPTLVCTLASVVANALINGDGRVVQRVDYAASVSGTYGYGKCDRWKGALTGTAVAGTLTQDQSTVVGQTTSSIKWSGLTLTGAGVVIYRQFIQSADAQQMAGQIVSLSAKVRHDVGSAINFAMNLYTATAVDNFGGLNTVSTGSAQSVQSATPTTISSYPIAMPSSAANGILVEITAAVGVVAAKNVWLSDAQLELGSTPSTYGVRAYSDELARCQFFYESKTSAADGVTRFSNGFTVSSPYADCILIYNAPKRTTPTVTISAAADFALLDSTNTTRAGSSASTFPYAQSCLLRLTPGAGTFVTGGATVLFANSTTAARINIDADF